MDAQSHERIFVGYSTTSRSYRVYNKKNQKVEETKHVIFDEFTPGITYEKVADDDVVEELPPRITSIHKEPTVEEQPVPQQEAVKPTFFGDDIQDAEQPLIVVDLNTEPPATQNNQAGSASLQEVRRPPREWRNAPNYPHGFVIGDVNEGLRTRSSSRNINHMAFLSQMEPKTIEEASKDDS